MEEFNGLKDFIVRPRLSCNFFKDFFIHGVDGNIDLIRPEARQFVGHRFVNERPVGENHDFESQFPGMPENGPYILAKEYLASGKTKVKTTQIP